MARKAELPGDLLADTDNLGFLNQVESSEYHRAFWRSTTFNRSCFAFTISIHFR
jgi:hypothetical protein